MMVNYDNDDDNDNNKKTSSDAQFNCSPSAE